MGSESLRELQESRGNRGDAFHTTGTEAPARPLLSEPRTSMSRPPRILTERFRSLTRELQRDPPAEIAIFSGKVVSEVRRQV